MAGTLYTGNTVGAPRPLENRTQQHMHRPSSSEQTGWSCKNLWEDMHIKEVEHLETLYLKRTQELD